MTAIQNYSILIDSIFGAGTTTFDTTKDTYNHIMGALNNQTEFAEFKANFIARLKRLKLIYSSHPDYLKEIIVQVNLIAKNSNWEGAFAELAAFDHLNQDFITNKSYLFNPIKPNVTIGKSKTFALELGRAEANLDGFVEDHHLYFDIKTFKDNVNEILEGLFKQFKKHIGINDFHISAEYDLSMYSGDIESKRNDLFEELKKGIIPADKTSYLKSSIIKNLNYRILWGGGVLTSERIYGPYSHAENHHKMIFKNADQFVKDKPSFVIYVVFPWYNGIVTDFSDGNIKLYRSFSRRVFCQYKFDSTKFNSLNSIFTGDQTIFKVSNHISGIIFLEDNTIKSDKPDKSNVKSFVYLNPNAINSVNKSLARHFIMGLDNSDYDDFENDNY